MRYADQHVRRAAIELGPEEMLGRSPDHLVAQVRSWRELKPALIQLTGDPEPELLAGLDPELVGKSESRDLRAIYSPLVSERNKRCRRKNSAVRLTAASASWSPVAR